MKRKIRIIIAAIVALSGVFALLAPAGEASADSAWCTLENGEYQEHFAKYCAHQIGITHGSTKISGTYTIPGSSKTATETKAVSSWCLNTAYATTCKKIIKDHFKYNNNSSYAPTKDYFIGLIYDEMKQGKDHIDPCGSVYQSGQAGCKSSNWEYYKKSKNGSDGGSGSGGSEGGSGGESKKGEETPAKTGNCTSILPASWCNKDNPESLEEDGIIKMVKFVISVMTGAVVVAGTIGIVICGVLWMTARDNPTQISTAKRRLLEIVIGMIAWGLIAVLINFFIPQSEATTESKLNGAVVMEDKEA